jgi:hypothetical protein
MFYFAHFAILLLGMMLANAWSTFFANLHQFGSPAGHILRTTGIYLGIYSVVAGLPYFLLWRSYRRALLGFVSVQDEVLVSGKTQGQQPWLALVGLTVLLLAGLIVIESSLPLRHLAEHSLQVKANVAHGDLQLAWFGWSFGRLLSRSIHPGPDALSAMCIELPFVSTVRCFISITVLPQETSSVA